MTGNSNAADNLLRRSIEVALRWLSTRGVGDRTLDRILSGTVIQKLPDLLALSELELVSRFRLKPEVAAAFLANDLAGERMWSELSEHHISVLIKGTPEYPAHLANALGREAPPLLFASGNRRLLDLPGVGFCGSRKASDHGLAVTAECAGTLAAKGMNIVSGYAHGVDLAAHRAALTRGGVTTIVLAEGILGFRAKSDIKALLEDENHLIVSSFSPNLPWVAHQAMSRNAVIIGLSNAMVLVESGPDGGTFAAGQKALELRQPLFVVDFEHPAASASGNAYFLEHGATPLSRDESGAAGIGPVIRAVELQREHGNAPLPDPESLFHTLDNRRSAA